MVKDSHTHAFFAQKHDCDYAKAEEGTMMFMGPRQSVL